MSGLGAMRRKVASVSAPVGLSVPDLAPPSAAGEAPHRGRLAYLLAVILFVGLAMAGSAGAQDGLANFVWHESPQPLPALTFEDSEGMSLGLADFRGKVVLLNIWATWCGPCRKEMPTLDRLQSRLGGRDFQVVALSVDRGGTEDVEEFYREVGVKNLAIYLDSSADAAGALGIFGIPTTLLIDREGREIGRLVGPAEWDSPEALALIEPVLVVSGQD